MPDDSPPRFTHRQRRAGERVGYLSREQRGELELLDRLFQAPEPVVHFRPAAKTMRGYQEFATGTMWHLATLAQRGWVELIARTEAGPVEEPWWEAVAAVLTAIGRTNYLALRARAALEDSSGHVGEIHGCGGLGASGGVAGVPPDAGEAALE